LLEPRHKRKAVGDGEAFPEEEANDLKLIKNLLEEQSLDRQILF
jgi:hypothetical protein